MLIKFHPKMSDQRVCRNEEVSHISCPVKIMGGFFSSYLSCINLRFDRPRLFCFDRPRKFFKKCQMQNGCTLFHAWVKMDEIGLVAIGAHPATKYPVNQPSPLDLTIINWVIVKPYPSSCRSCSQS